MPTIQQLPELVAPTGADMLPIVQNNVTFKVALEHLIPEQPDATTWENLSGKPATFPPAAHTHVQGDVTDLLTTIQALQTRLSALESAPPASGIPSGVIAAWWNATPPTGWVLADGHATTNEPTLAAIFGANVPNFAGKMLMGAGGVYTLHRVGGKATHILKPSELPASSAFIYPLEEDFPNNVSFALNNSTFWGGRGGEKGGKAHENLPPYTAITWIIKL